MLSVLKCHFGCPALSRCCFTCFYLSYSVARSCGQNLGMTDGFIEDFQIDGALLDIDDVRPGNVGWCPNLLYEGQVYPFSISEWPYLIVIRD